MSSSAKPLKSAQGGLHRLITHEVHTFSGGKPFIFVSKMSPMFTDEFSACRKDLDKASQ